MKYKDYAYNNGRLIAQNNDASDTVLDAIDKLDIEFGTSGDFGEYFRNKLKAQDWDHKGTVVPELTIRYGFRKNQLGVETQFSNVARFYSDIFKLELSYNRENIEAGILILPTKQHANQIGSNLANFERAKDELVHSRPMYTVPLWLIGIKMKI
jgi:hypothetical protein